MDGFFMYSIKKNTQKSSSSNGDIIYIFKNINLTIIVYLNLVYFFLNLIYLGIIIII